MSIRFRTTRWRALGGLAVCVCLLAAVSVARGATDPTFGRNGLVRTDFGGTDDRAKEVVRQPNGRIVAVGSSGPSGSTKDIALSRYLPNGALDVTFGTGGKVLADLGGDDDAVAAVVQPDGKIIAVGERHAPDDTAVLALVRFNVDGSPDVTFGSRGVVLTDLGTPGGHDVGFAAALQRDGKIVVAGEATGGGGSEIAVARYLSDGRLDPRFGESGIVVTHISPPPRAGADYRAFAVAIQGDERILVGGETGRGFVLVRYRPDGNLDESFGSGGVVVPPQRLRGFFQIRALLLQRGGTVVAVGTGESHPYLFHALVVARFNRDGRLDRAFGSGGVAWMPLRECGGISGGYAAVLHRDGGVTVAGGDGCDLVLARYRRDGRLDPALGGTGVLLVDFGRERSDYASGLVQQRDGKLIAGGATVPRGAADFALTRLRQASWRGTRFASLTATPTARANVVSWRTLAEAGTRAFNVYCERVAGGRRVRLNAAPVAARGGRKSGAAYSFRASVPPDLSRPRPCVANPPAYWLEEVGRDGRRTWFGPIVTFRLP